MVDRIKAVRKALELSQDKFGEKIGVTRDVINNIENNRVPCKDPMLKHMIDIFSINEVWLKTGEGKMFIEGKYPNKKLMQATHIFEDLEPNFQEYALELIGRLLELQKQEAELRLSMLDKTE